MRLSTTMIAVSLLLAGPALAREPGELVTDRPDQTESSLTVVPGFYQLEIGFSHAETDEAALDLEGDALFESLLRIGMTDALEIRIGFDGYQSEKATSGGTTLLDDDGMSDTNLGAKLRVRKEKGRGPGIAVMGTLSLPTGAEGFSSERVDPALRLIVSHTLTERLALGYNIGPAWSTEEDGPGDRDTLSVLEWTAVLGISVSDRVGVYTELFGDSSLSARGSARTLFNSGATWQVRDNLQFDATVGVGLSDSAEDWFGSLGLSWRFPR